MVDIGRWSLFGGGRQLRFDCPLKLQSDKEIYIEVAVNAVGPGQSYPAILNEEIGEGIISRCQFFTKKKFYHFKFVVNHTKLSCYSFSDYVKFSKLECL